MPDAIIEWRNATTDDLGESFCLYALADPESDELGYIGKAYRSKLSARLKCRSKDPVLKHLSREGMPKVVVLFGEIILPPGQKISEALVSDIESLLIKREQPIANVQSTKSRGYLRPNFRVACLGDWPGSKTLYVDR